jgi:hypothetical protein
LLCVALSIEGEARFVWHHINLIGGSQMFRKNLVDFCRHLFVWSNLFFLSVAPAFAGATPKQLYNKTVKIVWGESISEKSLDGRIRTLQNVQQRLVYVSSLGRIFTRSKSDNKGGSRTIETAPENARAGKFNFQGNSMTGIGVNGGVARRVVASFDPPYSSCAATVTAGKSSAAPQWKGLNGETLIVEDIKVGQISCTINDGNGL